jgi:molecular chaperone GrpE
VEEILIGQNEIADFQKHNVIFVTPVPSLPDNAIIHVDQKGYMLGERVLRAAKIGVVKNS